MKPTGTVSAMLCVIAGSLLIGCSASSPAGEGPSRPKTLEEYNASLPKDVYPDSRSRIPLIKREDLEEDRRRGYDERVSPSATSLAGLQGPGGLAVRGESVSEGTILKECTGREDGDAGQWRHGDGNP